MGPRKHSPPVAGESGVNTKDAHASSSGLEHTISARVAEYTANARDALLDVRDRKRKARQEPPQASPVRKKKKPTRGHRSQIKHFEDLGKKFHRWWKKGTMKEGMLHWVETSVLNRFLKGGISRDDILETIDEEHMDYANFTVAPEEGIFCIRERTDPPTTVEVAPSITLPPLANNTTPIPRSQPKPAADSSERKPRHVAIRLPGVMTEEQEERILGIVRQMIKAGLTAPDGREHRSINGGAHHMGLWSKYHPHVFVSLATRMQNRETKRALNDLFVCIAESVVAPIMAFLDYADPSYARVVRRIDLYVHLSTADIPEDPDLPARSKLGPLFNVFAMKEGGSPVPHVDFGDGWENWAIIITTGNYPRGEFLLPHLRLKIPLQGCDVLLINARKLVHCTNTFDGHRFVITGFIDYNTALHAGIKEEKFWTLNDEEFLVWIKDRIAAEKGAPPPADVMQPGLRRSSRLAERNAL